MAKSALDRLDDANIRSLDLWTGDLVCGYLCGDMTRAALTSELKGRQKELKLAIVGITKMLKILPKCPPRVILED